LRRRDVKYLLAAFYLPRVKYSQTDEGFAGSMPTLGFLPGFSRAAIREDSTVMYRQQSCRGRRMKPSTTLLAPALFPGATGLLPRDRFADELRPAESAGSHSIDDASVVD
jgi:hypothetical protein